MTLHFAAELLSHESHIKYYIIPSSILLSCPIKNVVIKQIYYWFRPETASRHNYSEHMNKLQ